MSNQKNIGGNNMSLNKSAARRRLSWLAGSSLVTASLAAASSLSLALVPAPARAQSCTPLTTPAANPGPDSYNCLAGTFPTGITYSSAGALTVNMVANGATVNTTLTANGANLTGNGADAVTWNSTIGTVTGAAGTAGPVIDALTSTGAINISTASVTGTAASVTHGIRARSTSGAITISASAIVTASNATAGVNAIEAVTAGDINITTAGNVNGRLRAIFTDTSSGAGTTTITAARISGGGIEARTGSGALTINLNGGTGGTVEVTTTYIKGSGAGAETININANNQLLLMDANASATTTLNIAAGGDLGQAVGAGLPHDWVLAQGAATGPLVVNNDGRITGRFNLGGVTGPVTIHNNLGDNAYTEGWATGGLTTFGSGADLIDNAIEGVIQGTATTTIDFGAGNDRLVNAGKLMTEVLKSKAGVMTLTGLETFENSGSILLGAALPSGVGGFEETFSDGDADDRLIAHGTNFVGSGDSRIEFDVDLAGVTQADCSVTPVAGDCVDFSGGSTSGSTLVTIRDVQGLDYIGALNDGITIVQGASSAADFTLDPNSEYYVDTAAGGGLQKQLVIYRLIYDEPTERLMLVGTLADEAVQPTTFAASAQETWRSTTGSWFLRQADLRATPGGLEDSAGAWGRIGTAASKRDITTTYDRSATTYSFDLSQDQQTSHLVFGSDMLRTTSATGAAVVGGMVGFVRSDVKFDASPTETVSTGFTGGIYASYLSGPLFVDGVFNINLTHLKVDAPNMGLGISVPLTRDILSTGGQVEAGWRLDFGGGAFVEPLGGLSYVITKIDSFDLPGGGSGYEFDDKYTSLRASAGLRLGTESQLMGMTSSYSLTGRYWHETQGENAMTVHLENGNTTTQVVDDFSGNFGEIAGSVSLYSRSGDVSGFVNLGGKFADGYQSVDGAVGVRLRW